MEKSVVEIKNKNLNIEKKDEFYTYLEDIEKEFWNYKGYFDGKVVYCNCDDPFESNFVQFFLGKANLDGFKIDKLIATSYKDSPIANKGIKVYENEEIKTASKPYIIYLNRNQLKEYQDELNKVRLELNGRGIEDSDNYIAKNTTLTRLINRYRYSEDRIVRSFKDENCDGDFRSEECIELLKEADIVVASPPLRLFKEYINQLIKYNKKYIIYANINVAVYKEVLPLIVEGKLSLGFNSNIGSQKFYVPNYYNTKSNKGGTDEKGNKWVVLTGARWFNNLGITSNKRELVLAKKYEGNEYMYPKYDNYDAINVDRVNNIPKDYEGVMGVPLTFLDKYNQEQFELLGCFNNYSSKSAGKYQLYGEEVFVCPEYPKYKGPVVDGKMKYIRLLVRKRSNFY